MNGLTPEDARQLKLSAELRFFDFVKDAWPYVVPGEPFQANWHVEAICDHLQALANGDFSNLLINMPPRHGKSILCCVMYPAWLWIVDPAYRMIYASYSQTFAMRDSRETHRLIRSTWYQKNWAARYSLTEDADAQVRFENTAKGFRIATSPGGLGTGEGGDLIVVDDPHKADEVSSDVQRQIPIDWWNVTMQTRTGRFGRTKRLVVMQRLHEGDLSGDIIARGGYVHLCLPQEWEGAHPFTKSAWSGWRGDPRTQENELLWPDRFPRERIDAEQKPPRMTSVVYAGQYQQRPAPAEGGMFLRKWFKFYKTLPDEAPTGACISWDFTFKDLEDSDFVAGTAWHRYGKTRDTSTFYLLPYMVHDRMGFSASKMAVRTLKARYPAIPAVVVESAANGPGIIDDLKGQYLLIPWPPKGRKQDSKEARASVMQPYAEAGNIYLPDPSIAPWIEQWIYEHLVFPNGKNDDYVDSASQAIIYLLDRVGKDFHLKAWGYSKKYTGDKGETYRDARYGDEVITVPPVSERGDLKKARPMKPARIVP